ncbi:MAG: FAD-binding domain-containing protein [Hyphomonas sp.]
MSGVHLVWFKRDLRVHDHAALLAAMASGAPVIPLYIFEPGYWAEPELSRRQFDFLLESLHELDAALLARGSRLMVRTGDAVDVLTALHRDHGIEAIHAHEEAGLQWSLGRDRQVHRWARNAGISIREQASPAARWESYMAAPRGKAPEAIRSPALGAPEWPLPEDFGLGADDCPARQPGGRSAGVECLRAFLDAGGKAYAEGLIHPRAGAELSSRLSAHLAFGTVSLREAWQGARRAQALHTAQGDTDAAAALDAFLARLSLHGDCLRMLQDQTSLDGRNLQPAHDGVRPLADPGDPRLVAWIEGRTGFPFLDASLRALKATGWLNYQTRAMVMGFVSHHLWLDWRLPAERIAARFTDFEPAIHYAQARMQAAATGAEAPRVFNPVKQSVLQDPDGAFIRQWVPELARLPNAFLHAPWEAPPEFLSAAGVVLGQTYPMRIVDHMAAANEARTRIAAVRRENAPSAAADDFKARLGVRRRPAVRRASPKPAPSNQLALDLGLTHAS